MVLMVAVGRGSSFPVTLSLSLKCWGYGLVVSTGLTLTRPQGSAPAEKSSSNNKVKYSELLLEPATAAGIYSPGPVLFWMKQARSPVEGTQAAHSWPGLLQRVTGNSVFHQILLGYRVLFENNFN